MINAVSTANAQYMLKVIIIGEPSVGKTSLRRRFMGLSFEKEYLSTLGFDISIKNLRLGDKEAVLSIYDIGGQQYYKSYRQNYYRNTSGIIYVFDITADADNEQILTRWIEEINQYALFSTIPVIIIGNKIDKKDERKVSAEDVEKLLEKIRKINEARPVLYFETSAKKGDNVDAAFKALAEHAIQWIEESQK